MKVVVQRVSKASVTIEEKVVGSINQGICVFVGIIDSDNDETIKWMANKLINLRIFNDDDGKMNKSVSDVNGGILLISNFTLYGDVKKGFRPSFGHAAHPDLSEPIYDKLVEVLKNNYSVPIATGQFGAMMDVSLINDGPVTIIIEKEND